MVDKNYLCEKEFVENSIHTANMKQSKRVCKMEIVKTS